MSINHPFGRNWRGGLIVAAIIVLAIVLIRAGAIGMGWVEP